MEVCLFQGVPLSGVSSIFLRQVDIKSSLPKNLPIFGLPIQVRQLILSV